MTTKKLVKVREYGVDGDANDLLKGTLDEIRAGVESWLDSLRQRGVTLVETDFGHDGGTQLEFYSVREETDMELKHQLLEEERSAKARKTQQEQVERRERAQLAALKAKYG